MLMSFSGFLIESQPSIYSTDLQSITKYTPFRPSLSLLAFITELLDDLTLESSLYFLLLQILSSILESRFYFFPTKLLVAQRS